LKAEAARQEIVTSLAENLVNDQSLVSQFELSARCLFGDVGKAGIHAAGMRPSANAISLYGTWLS